MAFLIVLAALCFLMLVAYRGYSVILLNTGCIGGCGGHPADPCRAELARLAAPIIKSSRAELGSTKRGCGYSQLW